MTEWMIAGILGLIAGYGTCYFQARHLGWFKSREQLLLERARRGAQR